MYIILNGSLINLNSIDQVTKGLHSDNNRGVIDPKVSILYCSGKTEDFRFTSEVNRDLFFDRLVDNLYFSGAMVKDLDKERGLI